MILVVESVVLCLVFTGMVYLMSRDPIKTLYNYPPKIQARVQSLPEYQGKIPTQKNKAAVKLCASMLFVIVLALILRYVNGCTTFLKAFGTGFLLWTVVNLWDDKQINKSGVMGEKTYDKLTLWRQYLRRCRSRSSVPPRRGYWNGKTLQVTMSTPSANI